MSLETKHVPEVRAYFSDTEVIVHPHVHWYLTNKAADAEENPPETLDQLRAYRPGAMRHAMAPALHPYVLLNFLPLSQLADKQVPLAVLFHRDIAPVVMIRHDWQVGFDTEDCQFLMERMDDCTNTPPERVLALFQQLEALSVGPLRATGSGIVTAESLVYLMYEVLGQTGVPGRWAI